MTAKFPSGVLQNGTTVPGGIDIGLALTRSDLADFTGTTLFTISRIMSAWQKAGIVQINRKRLVVADKARLSALARPSERG
ncbi:MAG: helix-turn-helix domain-containing protein [Pseudomonadota bacterium]